MSTVGQDLRRTPLNDAHEALGAKMVPFAGFSMPVQYPTGIVKEHQAVRTAAGLFDVSHMGEFVIRGDRMVDYINYVTTNDVAALADGQVHGGLAQGIAQALLEEVRFDELDSREARFFDHRQCRVDRERHHHEDRHRHHHPEGQQPRPQPRADAGAPTPSGSGGGGTGRGGCNSPSGQRERCAVFAGRRACALRVRAPVA